MSTGPERSLEALRAEIDSVDERLVAALTERLRVCDEIALVKRSQGLPALDAARENQVVASRAAMAGGGLDGEMVAQVMRAVTRLCRDRQERILKGEEL